MVLSKTRKMDNSGSESNNSPRARNKTNGWFWGSFKNTCSYVSDKFISPCDNLCTGNLSTGSSNLAIPSNLVDRRSYESDDAVFLLILRANFPKAWNWVLAHDCLVCCPQSASLPQTLSLEDIQTHILAPTKIAGDFESLNGKIVNMVGAEMCTKKSFPEMRNVRVLRMEQISVPRKEINLRGEKSLTVVHISQPFQGGVECPEEPEWMDNSMVRKFMVLMKSHPEMEPIFDDMNTYIDEFNYVAEFAEEGLDRIDPSAESALAGEWNQLVHAMLSTGCFQNEEGIISRDRRVQLAQFAESYLTSGVYKNILPWMSRRYRAIDAHFSLVVHKLQHHTASDIGITPEFQCTVTEAVEEIKNLNSFPTPMEKLLCLKRTQNALNRAVQSSFDFNYRQGDFPDLTTDDTVLLIVYTILQAYPHSTELISNLAYIKTFHFVPLSTSALGFVLSNFEVAADWLLSKVGLHVPDKDTPESEIEGKVQDVDLEESITDIAFKLNTKLPSPEDGDEKQVEEHKETSSSPSVHRWSRPVQSDSPRSGSMVMIYGDAGARQSGGQAQTLQIVSEEDDTSDGKPSDVKQVVCGQQFFGVVTVPGQLQTWGLAEGGRLGHGPDLDIFFPIERPLRVRALMSDVVEQVACGSHHVVCVTRRGEVYAWGDNRCGQLGILGEGRGFYPEEVRTLRGKHIKQVCCGSSHTLALTSGGQVYSWGRANGGRLGRIPVAETGCDYSEPGLVDCTWEYKVLAESTLPHPLESYKNKENDTTIFDSEPGDILSPEDSDVSQITGSVSWISAGWAHSIAVTSQGSVFTWGVGLDGRLGHGSHCSVYFPTQIRALASEKIRIKKAVGGYGHTVMLSSSGHVFATGLNKFGQVGLIEDGGLCQFDASKTGRKNNPAFLVPLKIKKLQGTKIVDISAGENHNSAQAENGKVFTWGLNLGNQCAQGRTVEQQPEPLEVAILSGAKQVVCGAAHMMVVM